MPITFLGLRGGGSGAVPFDRRDAPNNLTSVAVNPADSLRLKRYEEHWRFYQGLQWNFQREDGEPLVTANYCRALVDKKASWLVGKGMHIDVPEALTDITKPVLDEVWDYNQRDRLLLELAVMGGVTGDVFLLPTYQAPTSTQLALNPYTQGKIRIRLLGSHQVFPYWNPLNKEELLSVRIVTEVSDSVPVQPGDHRRSPSTPTTKGVAHRRRYVEDIFPDRIVEGWDDQEKTMRPNDLGEIPLVHFPNVPFPGEYYGLSDLDGLIDIQREFNEKLTDVSDIVNYHSSPITIITGAKAKNLEKGPKALWSGLPADARVFNLELGGDLPASHRYLELVRQVMLDMANVPEGSLGRDQAISNTSAAALQVQFMPLNESVGRKRPGYEAGLAKVNYFILRYDQLVRNRMYPVDLCADCGGRIVRFVTKTADGREVVKEKCYLIDPQTLEFMKPEDVEVSVTIEHSFGSEVRKMPFGRVKELFGKKSPSFWDPSPMVDAEEEMQQRADHEAAEAEQKAQDTAAASEAAMRLEAELKAPKVAPQKKPVTP